MKIKTKTIFYTYTNITTSGCLLMRELISTKLSSNEARYNNNNNTNY